MKTKRRYLLLCSIIVLVNIFQCSARIITSPVYVNSPDSSVHALAITNGVKCKPKMGRSYYWYNMNSILSSDGGFSGRLLHGAYTSYFHNHNLKCQGVFDRGLKQGTWTTWFLNGKVSERTHYSNGVVDGSRELYDSLGHLTMRIYYRNGIRAGKTIIFSQTGADSVIRYKNGVAVKHKTGNDSVMTEKKRRRVKNISVDTCITGSADSVKMNKGKKVTEPKPVKHKTAVEHPMKHQFGEMFRRKKSTQNNKDHE